MQPEYTPVRKGRFCSWYVSLCWVEQKRSSTFHRQKQIKIPLHPGSMPLAPWFNKTFQISLKASRWKAYSVCFLNIVWHRILDHNVKLRSLDFSAKHTTSTKAFDSSLGAFTKNWNQSNCRFFTVFTGTRPLYGCILHSHEQWFA